ncbi:alanine racemase [Alkalimonas sp.]|uniref:alanine racemase n=1 Tax=Alkalimonas sp. TaxID=1872453 RepID=UPI00263A68BD|nr:alanine racemase [Alkalimonas sp.]MCC5825719.1 alanine racemase [Alkalimonas sp.]
MKHKADFTASIETQPCLLHETVPLPAAVIRASALVNNIRWMQTFANAADVALAPHGKTSMTPAIFRQQLAAGAWGLTVATPYQAMIAAQAGAKRIILANQLVGKANMAVVAQLLQQGIQLYVCVDDSHNAQQLSAYFDKLKLQLPCLVELGTAAGRCGLRDLDSSLQLADVIYQLNGLRLAGVEFYEGIAKDEPSVRLWIQQAARLCQQLQQRYLTGQSAILTGAGSVWYDVVAAELQAFRADNRIEVVLRPGCYITHDHQLYACAQQQIQQRSQLAQQVPGDLQPALEVAAYVQSLPEPGLAVLGLGKRDIAFDAGMPKVLQLYRAGKALPLDLTGCESRKIMDQHTFWHYPPQLELQIGDIAILGSSHPCLTFDKWRSIWLVDDTYRLLEAMETCF